MKKIKDVMMSFGKNFSFKKTIVSCLFLFLSISVIFPAGFFSNDVHIEACANYYSDIAKNHTTDVGKKKLSGLIVEPKNGSTHKMREDTDKAITELWGVFKGQNASFAPVINANRDNDIYFVDTAFSNESLPIVYTNVGQSSEVYHTKNGVPVDYKFQSSPLALMFSSFNKGMHDDLHIYISQSQAERKLLSLGKEITKENLQSLQDTRTEMQINGVVYNCIIDNIYLDNFEHTYKFSNYDYYYGTDIGTIIGDFVFVIFYAVWADKCPPEATVKRESLYVMSEYSFRNKFFIQYAKEYYSPNDYLFRFAESNFKDGFLPTSDILEDAIYNSHSIGWCVFFTLLSISLFIISLAFIYIKRLFIQPLSVLCLSVVSLIPYLVFRTVYKLTNNLLLFSSYSLFLNVILLVILFVFLIASNILTRKRIMVSDYDKKVC